MSESVAYNNINLKKSSQYSLAEATSIFSQLSSNMIKKGLVRNRAAPKFFDAYTEPILLYNYEVRGPAGWMKYFTREY